MKHAKRLLATLVFLTLATTAPLALASETAPTAEPPGLFQSVVELLLDLFSAEPGAGDDEFLGYIIPGG